MPKVYDYPYGKSRIELDEDNAEYVRVTCLDRAKLALEQTGQLHCSQIMERLQIQFNELSDVAGGDPNKPYEMLDFILRNWKEGVEI